MEVAPAHGPCNCALETLLHLEVTAYYAVRDRDLIKLKRILDTGLTGNHTFSETVPKDGQSISLLQLVVQENFHEGLKMLLFKHNEPLTEVTVQMAFMFAMKNNLLDCTRIFLKAVINDKIEMELSGTFRHAMYKGQYDLVAELIRKASFGVNMQVTWGLEQPLHVVVHHRQASLVEILLQRGALVDGQDRKGTTPLIVACSFCSQQCAQVLLTHGADPNHKACQTWYTNYSALHAVFRFALNANSADIIINLLVRSGIELSKESWLLSHPDAPENIFPQTLAWLRMLKASPQSLLLLVFAFIRKFMKSVSHGTSILPYLKLLPLPPSLIRYLCMEYKSPVQY